MILEFERTTEDVIDFNLFHMAHSPSVKRQVWAYRILTTLFIILAPLGIIYFNRYSLSIFTYLISFLMGVIFFIAYPYIDRKSNIRRMRKILNEADNRTMLGHCTITLSPEGIITKTEKVEGKINWSAVIKTVQSEKHVFLYIGSINAYVIPKAAFANDGAEQEFLDYVMANTKKEATS